jgi:hypothetical protein
MDPYSELSERSPGDLVLFGIGFFAYILAMTGVIISSVALAVLGGVVFLVTVCAFAVRDD